LSESDIDTTQHFLIQTVDIPDLTIFDFAAREQAIQSMQYLNNCLAWIYDHIWTGPTWLWLLLV